MKAESRVLLFKVLANAVRLKLVEALSHGEISVNELCEAVREPQSRVSHELRCLTVCGLANYRREGKRIIYSLNSKTVLPILNAADGHVEKFADRMKTCDMISEAKRIAVHELAV